MPADGTRSASSDGRVWVVPESLRATLAARYGPVFSGAEADRRLRSLAVFATCGDVVTANAIALGNLPFIGIVDYKTRRESAVDPERFRALAARKRLRVRNPPGTLTERLRTAIRALVESGGGLIEVEGEEDLGALALVEAMPDGSTVVYGIPGEGASFVTVDPLAKSNVRALLHQMVLQRPSRSKGPAAR